MPGNFSKYVLPALVLAACLTTSATAEKNYTFISPGDTPGEIVEKAAQVTPLARQYEWQRLEFTAFIHFTINTFTDKEWGDGTEKPS